MIPLSRLWSWWTDTWRTPGRARLLYVAMALAFGGLAVVAITRGDALVAVLAGLGALVTFGLATIAPKLSRVTNAPLAEQGEQWKTH